MKKAFLMVILFLIPFVSASIYIDTPLNEQYNLGDSVDLSGYLLEDEDIFGNLFLNIECSNNSRQIAAKSIRIEKDIPKDFNFDLSINSEDTGNCNFNLQLNDFNNTVIDEINSDTFEITEELSPSFYINENQYKNNFQLGDTISISGTVLNVNDKKVDGLATITIKKDDINYVIASSEIEEGDFEYSNQLLYMPSGEYSVSFNIKDVNGNEGTYENELRFNLESELVITADTNKDSYKPGDIITLTGKVSEKVGDSFTGNKINVLFNDEKYTADIMSGEFSLSIPSASNIKSNEHNITLKVSDEFGNYGEKSIGILIIPIPTSLELSLDKESYVPEDVVIISSSLLDQAGDELSKTVNIKIKDVENNVVFEETALTTDQINYKLPQFSVPGEWNVEAEASDLEDVINLIVEPIEIMEVDLDGETLIIKNMGNEIFDDDIAIDGNGVVKYERVKLEPNETKMIPLFTLFDGGTYTISTLGKEFSEVTVTDKGILSRIGAGFNSITGGITGSSNEINLTGILSLLAIILAIGAVFYFVYKGGYKYYINQKPDHERRRYEMMEGAKRKDELKSKKKKYNFDFGKTTEKDVEDFRKRMVESVKEQPKKQEQKYNFMSNFKKEEPKPEPKKEEPKKDDSSQGGTFSMFD